MYYLVVFSESGDVSRPPGRDPADEDSFVVVFVGSRTESSGDGKPESFVGSFEPDVQRFDG